MHPTELPKPFHRDGWVYDEKYDGWSMVAEKAGNQVALTSRNGLDHTKRFPELAKAVEGLDAPSLVLDGEIAIFDRQLLSRFEWLRTRPKHEVATPPMYMVIDLLELEGEDRRAADRGALRRFPRHGEQRLGRPRDRRDRLGRHRRCLHGCGAPCDRGARARIAGKDRGPAGVKAQGHEAVGRHGPRA